jgi:hypothetical protein
MTWKNPRNTPSRTKCLSRGSESRMMRSSTATMSDESSMRTAMLVSGGCSAQPDLDHHPGRAPDQARANIGEQIRAVVASEITIGVRTGSGWRPLVYTRASCCPVGKRGRYPIR